MKVFVFKVRRGVPFPPVVGWLAALAKAMSGSNSRIKTVIDTILDKFVLIFKRFFHFCILLLT
jgi:hypothetical protein